MGIIYGSDPLNVAGPAGAGLRTIRAYDCFAGLSDVASSAVEHRGMRQSDFKSLRSNYQRVVISIGWWPKMLILYVLLWHEYHEYITGMWIYYGIWMNMENILWLTNMAGWKITILNLIGKSTVSRPCSIAMLVYQRVYCNTFCYSIRWCSRLWS